MRSGSDARTAAAASSECRLATDRHVVWNTGDDVLAWPMQYRGRGRRSTAPWRGARRVVEHRIERELLEFSVLFAERAMGERLGR